MPTDSALFLFAHQDDEFGVFHVIEDCLRRGMRVHCAYLTHGAAGLAATRNAESLAVLARLGVAAGQVRFAGDELGIVDASLPRHMAPAGDWLASFERVALVCVTAWEGGHHDHDALHFLAVHTARRLGLLERVRQYPLYRALGPAGPLFRVLRPLAANGPVASSALAWRARWRYLGLCLSYPSQRATWTGLFPFVLLDYLLRGRQTLQAVAPERLQQRPHAGSLYYERRRFYTWEGLQGDMARWLARGAP
jgi:hypothetical protein